MSKITIGEENILIEAAKIVLNGNVALENSTKHLQTQIDALSSELTLARAEIEELKRNKVVKEAGFIAELAKDKAEIALTKIQDLSTKDVYFNTFEYNDSGRGRVHCYGYGDNKAYFANSNDNVSTTIIHDADGITITLTNKMRGE